MSWQVAIESPYDRALSKNRATRTGNGRVFTSSSHRKARAELVETMRREMRLRNVDVAHNKLWLSIAARKPDHRGDAINLLDGVADALEKATGLNDKWFEVTGISWMVVPVHPGIVIRFGQEDTRDIQVCSTCKAPKPFEEFHRNRAAATGRSGRCKECTKEAR